MLYTFALYSKQKKLHQADKDREREKEENNEVYIMQAVNRYILDFFL